jgi:magnesium chelatase family protein
MGLAQLLCRAQVGLLAPPVTVEVHLGAGLPQFSIVGLPAAAVRESKERVRAALLHSGFEVPAGRITVNLAPADLPKEGGRFDLAIALGILIASGQLQPRRGKASDWLAALEFYGELALTGELRPVSGLLTAAQAARQAGHRLIVPRAGAAELTLLPGLAARAARSLLEVCGDLSGAAPLPDASLAAVQDAPPAGPPAPASPLLLADVCGQQQAKRALVIAAAGAHSLLFVGPPGCGKSMLARRLPALLPPLDDVAALEVASIASLVNVGAGAAVSLRERPFRAPHHTTSASAIVGGGSRVRPGEITLAHHGVLFLDELPEFDRRVLEALREPLETGIVHVSRANLRAEYPARCQLVAAMNPCPCGYFGDAQRACRCSERQRTLYRGRLSGPLLDRIDLRVSLRSVSESELAEHRADRTTACAAQAELLARIGRARARQAERGVLNAALTIAGLEACAGMVPAARRLLSAAAAKFGLSLRGRHRCMRVARTIADLEECDRIEDRHVAEALALRGPDDLMPRGT